MSKLRVLVGTRKGAFVLSSDASRKQWKVEGPQFAGWEIYHLKGSPADPDRLYASQSSGWFGQVMQRSNDGGKTWETAGNQFAYEGAVGPHTWYDGSPHPYEFKRVWHLEPSLKDPDTVYAGVEDAAIFKSDDAGQTWAELPGLRTHETSASWAPGAGGLCLHTILIDPSKPDRMYGAISAAGVFRTDDGGRSWQPANRGLRSNTMPDQDAEVGHCVHRLAMHPSRPKTLFMQKHWDVMRTDDGGDSWREITLRRVFRHQRRPGLCVRRRRRQLDLHRPRPAGRAVSRGSDAGVIKVVLPANLQTLAGVGRVAELELPAPVTQRSIVDALETNHPALRGTMRDMVTKKRRPMIRFFACEEDWSDASPDDPLPDEVVVGKEPFLILGAIAGG